MPCEPQTLARLLFAKGLKPAADVHLRVCFAAVVPCADFFGGFPGPLKNNQALVIAMDDDPSCWILTLRTADFTSIIGVDHFWPPLT